MKRKIFLTMMLVVTMMMGVQSLEAKAASDPKYELYEADLSTTIVYFGEEEGYNFIIHNGGAVPHDIIQKLMNMGYLLDYVDELKALGYIDANYNPPGSAAPATSNTETTPTVAEPAPEPDPFTVEPIEPSKTMWATMEVNLRDGASTQYNKVGALKQYEEVTVTGVASTGWYQISKEDGTVCYVSNNYLTEEDPHNRTEYIYDENEGVVKEYEFTDVEPEVIDEVVEEIKEESKLVEETVEEETVTEEETIVTEEEPETESVEEAVVEETEKVPTWKIVAFVGMLIVLAVFIIDSIYRIVKGKKEKKEE